MLIEIRCQLNKNRIRKLSYKVGKACKLPRYKTDRVPHITLYGSFPVLDTQKREAEELIKKLSKKYNSLQYTIDGFGHFDGEKGKVIYCHVVPSKELTLYRQELADNLRNKFPSDKQWDYEDDFKFHITIADKLNDKEFERTWKYVNLHRTLLQRLLAFRSSNDQVTTIHLSYQYTHALRTSLISNEQKILFEFDHLQKRPLKRKEAKSNDELRETLRLFRISEGMEDCFNTGNRTYLISDLHLDHANIIKYCSRPFIDVQEMNKVLVNNWNNVVRDNPIYFLGDLSYGRRARPADYWLKNLSGQITFIRGNHEQARNSKDYHILEYKGYKFLLVHNPDHLPIDWNGWVIHGHKHNNDLRNYPFINGTKRSINVSAEVVNYKPVSLDLILSLNLNTIDRMVTIDSIPTRK